MFVYLLLQSVHFVRSQKIWGASLMAQTVKNVPAVQETCIRSLCWEDPLEEGMTAPSSILLENRHGQRSLAGCNHGAAAPATTEHSTKDVGVPRELGLCSRGGAARTV